MLHRMDYYNDSFYPHSTIPKFSPSLYTPSFIFFHKNPQIHKTSRKSKKLRNTVPNQYKTTTITPKYHIPNMKHI